MTVFRYFFFSSRRRHTRCSRDWSSDVCSSDLFVEQAVAASRALQEQLIRLGGASKGQVVEMGAARYLRSPPRPFDIVFLDPPFGRGALAEYVPMLDAGEWLQKGARVYLENEKRDGVPALPARWELLKSKSAGEVRYHLARVNARA